MPPEDGAGLARPIPSRSRQRTRRARQRPLQDADVATRQQDGAVAPEGRPDGLEDLERRGATGERPPAGMVVACGSPDQEEATADTFIGLAGMRRADRTVARHVIQNPIHDSLPQVARRGSIEEGAPQGNRKTAAREPGSGIAATSPPSSSRLPSGDADHRKTATTVGAVRAPVHRKGEGQRRGGLGVHMTPSRRATASKRKAGSFGCRLFSLEEGPRVGPKGKTPEEKTASAGSSHSRHRSSPHGPEITIRRTGCGPSRAHARKPHPDGRRPRA